MIPVIHIEPQYREFLLLIPVVDLGFEGRRRRPADTSVMTEEEEGEDLSLVFGRRVLLA